MNHARGFKLTGPKDAEKRCETLSLNLRPDEKMSITLAAQKARQSIGDYCRAVLANAAQEILRDSSQETV